MPVPKVAETHILLKRKIRIQSCPLTSGFPTRMTREAFIKGCERLQSNEGANGKMIKDNALYMEHCKACGGNPPEELTIVLLGDF